MARGLKFRIQKVEGLYYPCSENKGADQLRGYREADLRLCFRICKKLVFSRCGSFIMVPVLLWHMKHTQYTSHQAGRQRLTVVYLLTRLKRMPLINHHSPFKPQAVITQTCLCNIPENLKKMVIFRLFFYLLFHVFVQNIDRGYTLEPPH